MRQFRIVCKKTGDRDVVIFHDRQIDTSSRGSAFSRTASVTEKTTTLSGREISQCRTGKFKIEDNEYEFE